MSNTRCPSFNWLLIPLCAIVVGVLTMRLGVIELYLLSAYTIFVVAAHIHYGIRVVHPPLYTPFSTFIIIVTVVCFLCSCYNTSGVVLAWWLSLWSKVQTCIWPS